MAKDKKLFKRTFWGYGADGVYTYLKQLNDKLTLELQTKDAEIARLMTENAELSERLNEYGGATTSDMVAKPTVNANEIIKNAQKEADRIITEAKKAALAKQQELQELVRKERVKLRVLQAEVSGLKRLASSALDKFSGELCELVETE